MKSLLFLLLLTLGLASPLYAMEIEVEGNHVYATGEVGNDWTAFQAALDRPGVDTVVFVNSPGGDLWTGLMVGRLIAQRELRTVTAGHCVSACALMFLGGKERSFADSFRSARTLVGIHGAQDIETRQPNSHVQPYIYAFMKQRMGSSFNAEIMNKALYDMQDGEALLRVYDMQRQPLRVPVHCRSGQSPRTDCTEFKGQDALSLGVVTTGALSRIRIPEKFRPPRDLLGQAPTQALRPDAASFYRALGETYCDAAAPRCKAAFDSFATSQEHKAVAVSTDGAGLGIAFDLESESMAAHYAIYRCNHPRNQPMRLCETQFVDGFDVRPLLAHAVTAHEQALLALKPPAEKFHANEQFGGGLLGAAVPMRTHKLFDITPQQLDGVRTVATRDLALELKGAPAPRLIDVTAGMEGAIPGALTLAEAGVALQDAAADKAFEARFAGLLALLGPDKSQPIVFYGHSREDWRAVNAALRARRLGYERVSWYRGGLESWKAAMLPTAPSVLRAVAH